MTVSSILKRLDYIVTLYNPASSYALQAVYNNFYSMYYRKVLNGPGLLTIVVPDDHDIVQYLQDDLLVYGYKELNDYSIRSGWGAATSVILTAFCTGTGVGSAITLYWYKRYVSL